MLNLYRKKNRNILDCPCHNECPTGCKGCKHWSCTHPCDDAENNEETQMVKNCLIPDIKFNILGLSKYFKTKVKIVRLW